MKTLNISFEEAEFKRLQKDKGDLSWKAYILTKLEDTKWQKKKTKR